MNFEAVGPDLESYRFVKGKGAQEDAVHHAEQGGVGSDPEGKGDEGGEGEARRLGEPPQAEADVFEQRFQ